MYLAATDELTLTDRPSVSTPRADIRDAAALIWSPARNSLRAIPPYTMVVPVNATNSGALKKQF
ncbi:MAG: hypothetical protein HC841_01640 [Verrucomicrobiae bacterium]|nr:hypothetical protein [Verrucomicrobiae bacterium]